MQPNEQYPNDEISLVEILQTLWEGRWLISIVTAACAVLGGAYAFFIPQTYTAQLELRPLPTLAAQAYAELNAITKQRQDDPTKREPFFPVDPDLLQSLCLEDLTLRRSLVEAIKQHNYISRRSGESEQAYEDRVLTTAYGFELSPPTDKDDKRTKDRKLNWSLDFKTSNQQLAQLVLTTALDRSTKSVQSLLKTRFEQQVAISTRANRYALEDLRLNVNNTIEDYDKQIRNRLAFLREQAAIARSLGLAKNTIEAQTFAGGASPVVNVKTESPFYLRGYEAIEKEIQLLSTRKGKREYINELIEVEKKTRDIEQNRVIERAKLAFENSPIVKGPFQAAFYDIAATEFQSKQKRSLVLALALVAGLFIGTVVVLIRKAFINHKPTVTA